MLKKYLSELGYDQRFSPCLVFQVSSGGTLMTLSRWTFDEATDMYVKGHVQERLNVAQRQSTGV